MAAKRSTKYGKSTRKPRVAKPKARAQTRSPRAVESGPTGLDAHVLFNENKGTYWIWLVRTSGLMGRQTLFQKEVRSSEGKTKVLDYMDSAIAKLKIASDEKVLRTFGTENDGVTHYVTYADKWYGRVLSVENNARVIRTPQYG